MDSDIRLLGDLKGVIDLDAEIPNCGAARASTTRGRSSWNSSTRRRRCQASGVSGGF